MDVRLIGLTGVAGSGKDTFAGMLADEIRSHNKLVFLCSFAGPLKNGLKTMFGITDEELSDRELKEKPSEKLCGRSPRQAAQWLGTEFGRELIDKDIWVQAAKNQVDNVVKGWSGTEVEDCYVIFTDCRFDNEAEWIAFSGGDVIRIELADPEEGVNEHISEKGIDEEYLNYILTNDKSKGLTRLRESAGNIVSNILWG